MGGERMFFRELETERLFLRNISPADREFVFAQFSDAMVNRYLFDAEPLAELREADELIGFYTQPEPRRWHRWVLVRKADGRKLGTCGFHGWEIASGCCEVGYDLRPDFWGHGYMREAMRALLRFARNDMNLRQLRAMISVENAASGKLAESLGFAFSGEMRQEIFRGREYPHRVYTLCLEPEQADPAP